MRAVVIEDEALLRLYFIQQLEKNGVTVVGQAAKGAAALDLIGESRPDVAFLDIKLADSISGMDVARMIEDGSTTRVVLMTAYSIDQLGFDPPPSNVAGMIPKPVTEYDLQKIVRELQGA